MTSIGELLGLGAPADQDRINADLDLIRRHGIDALRTRIHGHAVPADLYIAAVGRLAHPITRERSAEEQLARLEAADERRQISRGGNR